MNYQSSTTSLSSKNVSSRRTQFALRFIQALERIKASRATSTTTKTLQQRSRLIKFASDASMASTVGPSRLWNRAMLLKIKNRARFHALEKKKKKMRNKNKILRNKIKRRQNEYLSNHRCGGLRRSDELRRLVPGGEGMDFCRLLGETAHYIKCLNTQVQVMQSLVDIYKTT